MILTKVNIQGFKSFARKAELKFNGNVTCVVGPNGCGKTNVVDAIRWGLGEQRASVFRADRMENLIFGGAQSAKPLGMAEVSITFDNSSNLLPIDYNEVVITRRLYRSGESEYLLNKNQVRLKDIQDLIMDTGIGADAYSVIELKMVEDILSDRAEDRRKLLESAAGVTKYKHRLKAAIRKLDATKNDLLRVNDIISEVERAVRSLKRQVDKARRYQEFTNEVRDLDLKRGRLLLEQFQEKLKPLQNDLKNLNTQKAGHKTEMSKEETALETKRLKLVEHEKSLNEALQILNKVIESIHQKEGDIRVGKERVASLEDRTVRYTKEIDDLQQRLEDQHNHLDAANRDRESLQSKIGSTSRFFNNKKKELEVFQQGLNLKRLDLNHKKKEIIECLELMNQIKNKETQIRASVDNCQGRLERLEEEDKNYHGLQEEVKAKQIEMQGAIKSKELALSKIVKERDKNIQDEEKLSKAIESLKDNYFKDRGELDLLNGRHAFLKNLIENKEGVTDGAKLLLNEKLPGMVGVLADLIQMDPNFRQAVESGLGEASQYLLFDERNQAFQALDHLKAKGGGRVFMASLDRIQKSSSVKHATLPTHEGIVGWANDLVECDSRLKPLLQYLLGDLIVVNDLKSVQDLDVINNSLHRVVSLDGDIMTGWGVVQASEKKGQDSSLVGRKQRMEELAVQIQKMTKQVQDAEIKLKELESEKESCLSKRKDILNQMRQAEESVRQIEKQWEKLEFEEEASKTGIQKNSDERQRLLKDIEEGRENLENLRPELDKLQEKREEVEQVSSQIQTEVEKLEEEENAMAEEVHRHNLTLVRLNGEAKNLEYDIQRSQSLIDDTENTIDQRGLEIEEAKRNIVHIKAEIEEKEKLLVDEFKQKEVHEKDREKIEFEYSQVRDELQKHEQEMREVRRSQDIVSEKLHNLEMEITDIEHRIRALNDRMFEAYETHLTEVELNKELNLTESEERIQDLKQKIKNLGPVNLVALNEYDQEKSRLDFLTQQRDDLLSAEDTLKETILKINNTARERFLDVFSQVRKNFQETFVRFFQGGEADLKLPEDEDPLEAQIEIYARPTGKQMRDLDLLSGGEKALTAISLLFSLYQVKPSPFCILDEVDAPLDDLNVERFTKVLSEFAEKTQFILVTHNKMTMKAAQTLFGVTMQEEGVSKIVSVKFDEANL